MLFLRSRGKMKYVLGTVKEPKDLDPKFKIWDVENSMVMPWLSNSMQPEIGKPSLYLSTAKNVWMWDVVSQIYSKKGNVAGNYDLKTTIHNTKQSNHSMTV